MRKRLNNLRKLMREKNIPAFFITRLADIAWLTYFTGSTAYLLVTENEARFITDGRYETQVKEHLPDFWTLEIAKSYQNCFTAHAKGRIVFQKEGTLGLMHLFETGGASVSVEEKDWLAELRIVKDAGELVKLKEEYILAGNAFLDALSKYAYGDPECRWSAILEFNMKLEGASPSFETIVASGARGALPHGVASNKIIHESDAVTVDFGSKRIYNSDYTRVIYQGNDPEIIKIIDTVRTALEVARDLVRPGVKCAILDEAASNIIDKRGYKGFFNHSLGHGVGLEVHELPRISALAEETILKPGMVFTIEPGIYIPSKYGIRLEETVYVTETGCELLSAVLDKYVYTI